MKNSKMSLVWAAATVAAVAIGAAPASAQIGGGRRGFDPPGNGGNGGSIRAGGLEAVIRTDATNYPTNRGVAVTLTLTNTGDRIVEYVSNDYEYDITVRDMRTGAAVWQWSRTGGAGPRVRRTIRIQPGDSKTFREIWDQSDQRGQRVRSGTYKLDARVGPVPLVSTQVYLSGENSGNGGNNPGGGNGNGGGNNPGGAYRGLSGDLQILPRAAVVRAGNSVRFTYAVTNTDRQSITVPFSSGKQFDVVIRSRANGRIAWQFSSGRLFTDALRPLTIDSGDRRTFVAEWRVDDRLPDGVYDVIAYLTPMGQNATAATAAGLIRIDGNGNGGGGGGGRPSLPGSLNPGGGGIGGDGGSAERVRVYDLGNYVGKRVTVSGVYRGNQIIAGKIPPTNRANYWALDDGGNGVYCTGRFPFAPVGEKVTVTGRVQRGENGMGVVLICE